jgi:mRNA interferase RelE/StbE
MYALDFHPIALKEWRKLDNSIREQFKDKLAERLQNPYISSAQIGKKSLQNKIARCWLSLSV